VNSATVFSPPQLPVPAQEPAIGAFLRAIRTNALTMWPEAAYREEILVRRLFGRASVLVNEPSAIHRVLVENHTNYRRSPASIRILRPITGQGLLLSEGEAWRHQRRLVAPALAPRMMALLCRHIVEAAEPHLEKLAQTLGQPIDLLSAMQSTTLDVAGHSMFSLDMAEFGPPLRQLLTEFASDLSRPDVFDLVLPASIPTWRDLRRRRFRRRWLQFVASIMDARMAKGEAFPGTDGPRDLFDVLHSARDPETGRGFDRAELSDQLATLILAGHETTALTLFWSLTLLAQMPAAQERVASESATVDLTPEAAASSLSNLPITRAVVQEALRLYPPRIRHGARGSGAGPSRRCRHPDQINRYDRSLGAASPRAVLGTTADVRSGSLYAGCPCAASLCLPAFRGWATRLYWRSVRTERGNAASGETREQVSRPAMRRSPGAAGSGGHDTARSCAAVPAAAPVTRYCALPRHPGAAISAQPSQRLSVKDLPRHSKIDARFYCRSA
jgi:cytochrome P450